MAAVGRETTAGNHTMQVGMMEQVLAPSVIYTSGQVARTFEVTVPTPVLSSTAADTFDTWSMSQYNWNISVQGGGKQFFSGPVWFQLYVYKDRAVTTALVFATAQGQEIKQRLQISYVNNRIQSCYAIKGLFRGGRWCRCL